MPCQIHIWLYVLAFQNKLIETISHMKTQNITRELVIIRAYLCQVYQKISDLESAHEEYTRIKSCVVLTVCEVKPGQAGLQPYFRSPRSSLHGKCNDLWDVHLHLAVLQRLLLETLSAREEQLASPTSHNLATLNTLHVCSTHTLQYTLP